MNAQKFEVSKPTSAARPGRKPWKKRTPVQVVLEQRNVLRDQIAAREQELQDLRQQLIKFEEATKIFER